MMQVIVGCTESTALKLAPYLQPNDAPGSKAGTSSSSAAAPAAGGSDGGDAVLTSTLLSRVVLADLIIDEASQLKAASLTALTSLATYPHVRVVAAGDPRQLQPIQERDAREEARPALSAHAALHGSAYELLKHVSEIMGSHHVPTTLLR